jgi:cardiolipin synthase
MAATAPVTITKRLTRLRKRWLITGIVLLVLIATILVHTLKELPEGLSYESADYQTDDIEFLYNLSYERGGTRVFEERIYKAWYQAIEEAEQWLVLDMFMFASFHDRDQPFPELSNKLKDTIIARMNARPELKVVVITDEINTTYGSHPAPVLEELEKLGATVVYTDVDKLRDSNPLYSGAWRMVAQWFGQSGRGWITNPLSDMAPKVTARSMLKLLNVKANHRKVLLTEKTGIVMSANAHDASYYHSNIAFKFGGGLLREALEAERAVIAMSGGPELNFGAQELTGPATKTAESAGKGLSGTKIRLITEGKIEQRTLEALDGAGEGDRVWLGMFYLADREIVKALLGAADRGADVRLILDPNENAFGQHKIGLPNIPVAAELRKRSKEAIQIRWYQTAEEQYHTKLMFIESGGRSTIIGGSANYTRRNLDDLNLEADLLITAPQDAAIMQDVSAYFKRLWGNRDGGYTLPYDAHGKELPYVKMTLYALQKMLGFTSY